MERLLVASSSNVEDTTLQVAVRTSMIYYVQNDDWPNNIRGTKNTEHDQPRIRRSKKMIRPQK